MSTDAKTQPALTIAQMDDLVDSHFRAEETGDLDAIAVGFTPDAEHDVAGRPGGVLHGGEQIAAFYEGLLAELQMSGSRHSGAGTATITSSTSRMLHGRAIGRPFGWVARAGSPSISAPRPEEACRAPTARAPSPPPAARRLPTVPAHTSRRRTSRRFTANCRSIRFMHLEHPGSPRREIVRPADTAIGPSRAQLVKTSCVSRRAYRPSRWRALRCAVGESLSALGRPRPAPSSLTQAQPRPRMRRLPRSPHRAGKSASRPRCS